MGEDCACLLVEAWSWAFVILSLSVKELAKNKRAQTFDVEVKAKERTSNVELEKHVSYGREHPWTRRL